MGNAKFPGKFVWIFVVVFGLVLGFFTCLFWWGICLFVWIFVWFGFSLVCFFHFFFLFKISFIASSTSHLWNMPYQFSIQLGVMLLQLTVGFRKYMFLIMITSWLIELLQLGEDAWFLSSIISTPFSCKVLIHKSKPCLRQVLKGTVLIFVNMWNCFILSVCNCQPYLRSRKKMPMEKNFSIALQGYWAIKTSLMLVSNILSHILSLKNLVLGFGVIFPISPFPSLCWQVVICPMVFIKYGNVWVTSFPNGFRRELPPTQK